MITECLNNSLSLVCEVQGDFSKHLDFGVMRVYRYLCNVFDPLGDLLHSHIIQADNHLSAIAIAWQFVDEEDDSEGLEVYLGWVRVFYRPAKKLFGWDVAGHASDMDVLRDTIQIFLSP